MRSVRETRLGARPHRYRAIRPVRVPAALMSGTRRLPTVKGMRPSLAARIGLVLAGVLAAGDIITSVPQLADDPVIPFAVILVGVVTLAGVPFAWRGAAWARLTVVVTRVLSALSAVPAFVVPGVPAGWIAAAVAGIALSLTAVVLVLIPARVR